MGLHPLPTTDLHDDASGLVRLTEEEVTTALPARRGQRPSRASTATAAG